MIKKAIGATVYLLVIISGATFIGALLLSEFIDAEVQV